VLSASRKLAGAAVAEQPLAAQHDRVQPQPVLVDQVGLPQRLGQLAAADDHQGPARLPLQVGDRSRHVAVEDRGALPVGLRQRPGGDVLGEGVQGPGDLVVLVGDLGPGGGEDLVGEPAEQEAAGVVLAGVPGRLDDTVERHVLGHDQLPHGCAPSRVVPAARFRRRGTRPAPGRGRPRPRSGAAPQGCGAGRRGGRRRPRRRWCSATGSGPPSTTRVGALTVARRAAGSEKSPTMSASYTRACATASCDAQNGDWQMEATKVAGIPPPGSGTARPCRPGGRRPAGRRAAAGSPRGPGGGCRR
jgi:hypothetical protein